MVAASAETSLARILASLGPGASAEVNLARLADAVAAGGGGGGAPKFYDKDSLHGIAATSTQIGTTPNQMASWRCGIAAPEGVQFNFFTPTNFVAGTPVTVILHYAKNGTGSGNIVHRLNYTQVAVGDVTNEAGTNSDQTIAVAADPALTRQLVTWTNLFTPGGPGEWWRLNYRREGGDAADTYGDTSHILGFQLQY